MATLILTRGIPGSGKTTFAKEWVAESPDWRARVNRDDLRFAMYGKYVLDGRMQEDSVTVAQRSQVEALLKANIDVIVDDTNLRAATVRDWQDLAAKVCAKIDYEDFPLDLDTALARNVARGAEGGRFVEPDVIRSFYNRYTRNGVLPPVPQTREVPIWEPYSTDGLSAWTPTAILCDIDGTLAQMADRSPYDWKRVGEDTLIENVATVVRSLGSYGHQIIFMSGRDAACRQETADWLQKHGFYPEYLYMRAEGDMRSDDIVKYELFNKYVRNNFRVVGVFDDRLKVCRLWENMGLTLFRVGPIDSDF